MVQLFRERLNTNVQAYIMCDLSALYESTDKIFNTVALVQMVVVYVVLTQCEDEYLYIFEVIAQLKNDHQEIMKEFLTHVMQLVDNRSLQHSIVMPASSIQEFEDKFIEYDDKIQTLSIRLDERDEKVDKLLNKLVALRLTNKSLNIEVERLTETVKNLGDHNEGQIAIESENITKMYENKLKTLREKVEDLESVKSNLEKQLQVTEQYSQSLEIESKAINKKMMDFVPKDIYQTLRSEKEDLETRIIDLENSRLADSSALESLKHSVENLRSEHKLKVIKIEEHYKEKILALEQQLENIQNKGNYESHRTRNTLKQNDFLTNTTASDLGISYGGFLKMKQSSCEISKIQNGANDFMINSIENLEQRLIELREQNSKDSEYWRRKVKNLRSELASFKKINKSETVKSWRESSAPKKKQDLSEEIIAKMLNLEKDNKRLLFENQTLQTRLINYNRKMSEQMVTLQSCVASYFLN